MGNKDNEMMSDLLDKKPFTHHDNQRQYSLHELEREVEIRARELQLDEAEKEVQEAMLKLKERQAELKSREIAVRESANKSQAATPLLPTLDLRDVNFIQNNEQQQRLQHPVLTSHVEGRQSREGYHVTAYTNPQYEIAKIDGPADENDFVDLKSILSSAEAAQREAASTQEHLLDRVGRVEQAIMHPLRASGLGAPLQSYMHRSQLILSQPNKASFPMTPINYPTNSQRQEKDEKLDLQKQWQQQETWQQRQEYVAHHEPLQPFGSAWNQHQEYREAVQQPGAMEKVNQAYARQAIRNPFQALQHGHVHDQKNLVQYHKDPIRAREINKLFLRLETLSSAEKDLLLLLHEARDAVHYQIGKVASSLEDKMEHLLQQVHDTYSKSIDDNLKLREMVQRKIEILKTNATAEVLESDSEMNNQPYDGRNIRSSLWELESTSSVALRTKLLLVEGGEAVSSILRRRLRLGNEDSDPLRVVDALVDVVESMASDTMDKDGKYHLDSQEIIATLKAAVSCLESNEVHDMKLSAMREKMLNAANQSSRKFQDQNQKDIINALEDTRIDASEDESADG